MTAGSAAAEDPTAASAAALPTAPAAASLTTASAAASSMLSSSFAAISSTASSAPSATGRSWEKSISPSDSDPEGVSPQFLFPRESAIFLKYYTATEMERKWRNNEEKEIKNQ